MLQQVYLQLYLSLPTLLTTVSLKGWLFQVARNRCLDELRRRRRRGEAPFSSFAWDAGEENLSPLEAIPDPDPLPEELAERIDLYRSLQEAIASLPPRASPGRPTALFQATDLRGDWAPAQHAGDDGEDLLLPRSAALAQSTREQYAPGSRLVV